MKLVFQKKHLSITALEPTELPAFTVLTGVNGSEGAQNSLWHYIFRILLSFHPLEVTGVGRDS